MGINGVPICIVLNAVHLDEIAIGVVNDIAICDPVAGTGEIAVCASWAGPTTAFSAGVRRLGDDDGPEEEQREREHLARGQRRGPESTQLAVH